MNQSRKSISKVKLIRLPLQQQIKSHHKHGKLYMKSVHKREATNLNSEPKKPRTIQTLEITLSQASRKIINHRNCKHNAYNWDLDE